MVLEDERELVFAEGSILVREADARVQLWVAREPALDPGHADQDESDAGTVVVVAGVDPVGVVTQAAGIDWSS